MTATTSTSRDASPVGEAMRAFTRITAPLSRPLAGRRFFKLWGVVHHVGRRSGSEYATPVALRRTPDGFVIPLPWGERTQWARNVLAADGCRLRWNGADYTLNAPEVVSRAEGEGAFSPFLRAGLRILGIQTVLRLRRAS